MDIRRRIFGRSMETAHILTMPVAVLNRPWRNMLIGDSAAMRQVAERIELVAPRRCTLLISGETGTGKEVAARCVHLAGHRASHPWVAVNCSALPEHLLEAELFGHVKGAFTGAISSRTGRFEQAHRGTLFLDEIGDMSFNLQAKLLRVLQEREFQRLGASESIQVDVRIIAATNLSLLERVHDGSFREDLFYRLNVVPITLPPLRERPEDIPVLVRHFLAKICREEGIAPRILDGGVLDRLMRRLWRGNVRQLENAVEMAVALSGQRQVLVMDDFPEIDEEFGDECGLRPVPAPSVVRLPDHGLDFDRTVGAIERDLLEQAMRKAHGNKKMAAEMLRLKRTTLAAKLKTLSAVAG